MRKENGLTFIATIFLVLIIGILVFGAVYFTRNELSREELEDIKTNLLLVQAKVKKVDGDYILEKKDEVLIGAKLSDMKEDETIKEFLQKNLFDPDEKDKKYYVLNQEDLNQFELDNVKLKENSYYIVEYTSAKVYYTEGFVYTDGKTYYTLSDIEENETNNEVENINNSEKE